MSNFIRCRTRGSRTSAAKLLETPSPEKSPKSAILTDSSSKRSRKKTIAIGTTSTSSAALFESPSNSHFPPKTFASISDLKQMASSRLDDLKRHNEACQKVSDEAEKEYKKISERITQSQEAIMSSYVEFMADVQANASNVSNLQTVTWFVDISACKTSITKLSQSSEKAIDGLRSRYGVSSS
ncbi:hypothetical protein FEM48_Zijuj11G0127900 [Ziziphus jujuba var. spinosa]|uniref:Uncharacterized protein n=1 Tax=Ziziphus jujuba var. spinosa TaxID=714518 RepID=A0A978UJ09_ZIZJJ|nr:hypothetical protein FEM48_Zijuj11G0127900 [Ziziphus jujuba var. spinosa]